MTVVVAAQQKGGVGKTTSASNLAVVCARAGRRVLVMDTDPQLALTRQLGVPARCPPLSLVDVLAGRCTAEDAVVRGVHGLDVIPAARELAGVEMSLVGEVARERFLNDALNPLLNRYDATVIDTPPNLGLLTVNALLCASDVVAPVSGEDEASVYGLGELHRAVARLAERLGVAPPMLSVVLTRWNARRVCCRTIEAEVIELGFEQVVRVPSRSAAVTRAAARAVPLALSSPEHAVSLAYRELAERLEGVVAR